MVPPKPELRVTPLASGSAGNSLLVSSRGIGVLIDAGLPCDELEHRLEQVGWPPRRVRAVLLTHGHRDHLRGATEFCAVHRSALYATRRASRRVGTEGRGRYRRIRPLSRFAVEHLSVVGIPVEHDAPDTLAFLVEDGPRRYGHATDLGCTTGPIVDYLQNCDELLLEFNHDRELLATGPYSAELKRRIASPRGHLANAQAAELLARLSHPGLRRVWLAHLSRHNNRPELALAAAREALGPDHPAVIEVAAAHPPS